VLAFKGGVSVFAAHGVAQPVDPQVRGLLARALNGMVAGDQTVGLPLADGRTAWSAVARPIVWEGRTIGTLVALRAATRPVAEAASIDALARLAALDLYLSSRDLRGTLPAQQEPAAPPEPAAAPQPAAAPEPAAAPHPRRRPLATVILATALAQVLVADAGTTLLGGGGGAASDVAATATVLALAIQVLALLALRGDRALRVLLVLLLLTFVAAGMGILLAQEQPLLVTIRAAETLVAIGAAVLAARALRARGRAAIPVTVGA